jgi:hypothetical protein
MIRSPHRGDRSFDEDETALHEFPIRARAPALL